MSPDQLSAVFIRFAEDECRGTSPLYEHLAHAVAQDDYLLSVAAAARPGQPVPNLLFAAVHYLLDRERDPVLAAFYPSLVTQALLPENSIDPFREFVQQRQSEIEALLQTRRVQTNEVRRCAYLYPAFLHIAKQFPGRPLALIDIGTSAGLNLLADQYLYDYGNGLVGARGAVHAGSDHNNVEITIECRGALPLTQDGDLLSVSDRIGFDLNIVDVTDSDAARWLTALIWPEHHDRRETLRRAIAVRRTHVLDLREADGFAQAPAVASALPPDVVPCLFHLHVANQVPRETIENFLHAIDALGGLRDLAHLHNNIRADIHLDLYRDGMHDNYPVARADGHARWLEWLC